MTKAELVKKLSKVLKSGGAGPVGLCLYAVEIDAVLRALGPTVQQALAQGEAVPLPGIGILSAKKRPARRGRNPRTGAELEIPACTVPMFRPSKDLKATLNGGRS